MKAIIHTQYGPPEVAQLKDIPKPLPKENELLVKVYASTVNRTDSGFRSAEYVISRLWSGLLKPKQQTLGSEFSGVVEAVGAQVTDFKIGDKVFGFNDKQFGGHAEYLTIEASAGVTHMPTNVDFETAAAISEGAHYALVDIYAAKSQCRTERNGVRSNGSHRLGSGTTLKTFWRAGHCRMQHPKC